MKNKIVVLSVALLVLSPLALAQTGTVRKMKGKKAVVIFDQEDIPSGTVVSVSGGNAKPSNSGALRPRKHSVAYEVSFDTTKTKVSAGGTEVSNTTTKDSKIEVSYTYNWGRFELGGFIGKDVDDEGSSKTDGLSFGASGQLNFIENDESNPLIPYVGLLVNSSRSKVSGASNLDLKGTGLSYGLGLLWFPFSEIFAMDLNYAINSTDLEADGSPKIEVKSSGNSLSLGWRIYF